ncbi:MAG: formylglycine-generating enzyme family protein [Planctomycetota bacterium]
METHNQGLPSPKHNAGSFDTLVVETFTVLTAPSRLVKPSWKKWDSAVGLLLLVLVFVGTANSAPNDSTPRKPAANTTGISVRDVQQDDPFASFTTDSVWSGTRGRVKGSTKINLGSFKLYVNNRSMNTFEGYIYIKATEFLSKVEGTIEGAKINWSESVPDDPLCRIKTTGTVSEKANVLDCKSICEDVTRTGEAVGTLKRLDEKQKKTRKLNASVMNSAGISLALIPAGEFEMGSPPSEMGREEQEGPLHRVRISKPFYFGKTEVTQAQWVLIMGTMPWSGQRSVREGANVAASYIDHDDAIEFCKRLTALERIADRLQRGVYYRLPTEAEWEYACRAGTSFRYCYGDKDSEMVAYAWFHNNAGGIGDAFAHVVAQKKANRWGLHDMHGNVWEWCLDWHTGSYGGQNLEIDPQGPAEGGHRIARGGGWGWGVWGLRAAGRYHAHPQTRELDSGFRLVLDVSGTLRN